MRGRERKKKKFERGRRGRVGEGNVTKRKRVAER